MRSPVNRVLFNVVSDKIEASAQFYEELVGFKRLYTSDWYIVLVPEEGPALELGIIDRQSDITPSGTAGTPAGGYLTLVVENVEDSFKRAQSMGVDIIEAPTALDYGQTRMLIRDPNGLIVDISSPTSA